MKKYHRAEIARISGFSIETLRFYEEQNLLQPARDKSNYRIYTEKDLLRLKFISVSKQHNFTLKEIREMIYFINSSNKDSLLILIEERIRQTKKEISVLKKKLPKLQRILNFAQKGERWL